MNTIDSLRKLRTTALKFTDDLSLEQLNKIPDSFSNNIIWNLGHMIAAQQGICYLRAGLPVGVEEDYFERYKSGSKPARPVSEAEVAEIKSLLFSTLDQLEKDLSDGVFKDYSPVVTRYGVELSKVDDAIEFLLFHDGFHMAYMLALKRVI